MGISPKVLLLDIQTQALRQTNSLSSNSAARNPGLPHFRQWGWPERPPTPYSQPNTQTNTLHRAKEKPSSSLSKTHAFSLNQALKLHSCLRPTLVSSQSWQFRTYSPFQPWEVAQNENKRKKIKRSSFGNSSFPLPWLHSLKPAPFIQGLPSVLYKHVHIYLIWFQTEDMKHGMWINHL